MLGPVVQDMAPLAERPQVGRVVVAGIVIEVRARQVDAGGLHHRACRQAFQGGELELAAPAAAPSTLRGIPPTPVAKVEHELAVRTAAPLAAALGAAEPDHLGQLAPVDGVEEAVLWADRHGAQPFACWLRARACGKYR